jgi:hypothetical protein
LLKYKYNKIKKLILLVILSACNPFDYLKYRMHRCDSIIDIYYYPPNAKYNFQETEYCKYTLTILNKDVPTMRLNRKYYNKHKAEYESYGLTYPYKPAMNKPILTPFNYN